MTEDMGFGYFSLYIIIFLGVFTEENLKHGQLLYLLKL